MGRPKGQLPWRGTTLLEHLLEEMTSVAAPIVLATSRDLELPTAVLEASRAPSPRWSIAQDETSFEGPLSGLITGFSELPERCDAVFLAACDLPFLSGPILARFAERLEGHAAAVVTHAGRRHPLAAVYRRDVHPVARGLWSQGARSLQALLDRLDVRGMTTDDFADLDPELRFLRNINTPEEYAAALREDSVTRHEAQG
jgi:molybdopterin-guanine dinucleotide biosynthesis protein A